MVEICFVYPVVIVTFSSILVVYFLVVLKLFVVDLLWLCYSDGSLLSVNFVLNLLVFLRV